MTTRHFLLVFACFSVSLLLAIQPVHAQNGAPNTAETVQNIGSAHWRIGASYNSTGIYIQAPANLAVGGVEWAKLPATIGVSKYSAQNESVRVELVRGSASQYNALRDAAFDRIGYVAALEKSIFDGEQRAPRPNSAVGQSINVASYDGVRLEKDGKVALVVKYGTDVWAITLLPQSGKDAAASVKNSAASLWFERREAPEWKDRMIGSTSFQAELPFELSDRPSNVADTVNTSARWRNFWLDASEYRSGRVDLDGTVKLQIEDIQKQPGFKNVRVRQIPRTFGWAFLEGGERGQFVQIDYEEGERKRRIYKIFSVAGTRVVSFQTTLNADDPQHLLAAHRILATARLGWTDSHQFAAQKLAEDKAEIDSDSPFKNIDNRGINIYQGTNKLALAFAMESAKVTLPTAEAMDADARSLVNAAVKNVFQGAGGELEKSRVETMTGGIFPSRRVVFEGTIANKRINGDAALISTSRKVFFPFRLTENASFDFARRWATTFRVEIEPPTPWVKRSIGGIETYVPPESKIAADGSELSGIGDGARLKIASVKQPYKDAPNFHPGPNETSPITEGEIASALGPVPGEMAWELQKLARAAGVQRPDEVKPQVISVGSAFGVAGRYPISDGNYTYLEILLLHDGNSLWKCELSWNHNDLKSAQARDAILASIRRF